MTNPVVTLRAEIIKAATMAWGDEKENNLQIIVTAREDGLYLEFNNSALLGTPVKGSLTETLVLLGEEVANCLEDVSAEKRGEFHTLLKDEMREFQDIIDTDHSGDVDEWEGILDEVVKMAQSIKRRMDTKLLDESADLMEAAEALRATIEEFCNSQKLQQASE